MVTAQGPTGTQGATENTGEGSGSSGSSASAGYKGQGLLSGLVSVVQTEARDGLFPKGHPDCKWGYVPEAATGETEAYGDHYPTEYTAARDYLAGGNPDEAEALYRLSSLLYKIDSEVIVGTPLISKSRSWCDDGLPRAYHAAKGYVTEQMQKQERELLA